MAFYGHLVKQAEIRGVQTVAILPQPLVESKAYLAEGAITANLVLRSQLSSIDVSSTPTLVLLDPNGKVIRTWIGQLPPEKEMEVENQL